MTKPKFPPAKLWAALGRAVEEGVAFGWHRAFKHVNLGDSRSRQRFFENDAQAAREQIEDEVRNAIAEAFDFGDGEQ